MTLKLLIGILFHFVGDYLTQNNWLAQNKTKKIYIAFLHALIYSLPFLFIVPHLFFWLIILITHTIIDRYRLAQYWIKLVNWSWNETNYGYGDKTPVWLSTWLMIIIDNIFHILINCLVIYFYLS